MLVSVSRFSSLQYVAKQHWKLQVNTREIVISWNEKWSGECSSQLACFIRKELRKTILFCLWEGCTVRCNNSFKWTWQFFRWSSVSGTLESKWVETKPRANCSFFVRGWFRRSFVFLVRIECFPRERGCDCHGFLTPTCYQCHLSQSSPRKRLNVLLYSDFFQNLVPHKPVKAKVLMWSYNKTLIGSCLLSPRTTTLKQWKFWQHVIDSTKLTAVLFIRRIILRSSRRPSGFDVTCRVDCNSISSDRHRGENRERLCRKLFSSNLN